MLVGIHLIWASIWEFTDESSWATGAGFFLLPPRRVSSISETFEAVTFFRNEVFHLQASLVHGALFSPSIRAAWALQRTAAA